MIINLTQRLRCEYLLNPVRLELRQRTGLVQRKDLCDQTGLLPGGHDALTLSDSRSAMQGIDVTAAGSQTLQHLKDQPLTLLGGE